MPWIEDWKSGDMEYHCPICDSTECEKVYKSDGEIIGCDQCIDYDYIEDLDPNEEDYPDDEDE